MQWQDQYVGGISLDNGTRFIDTGGHAPVLVLMHDGAFGGSIESSWMHCISLLSSRFRIVAFDFFGFGRSDKLVYFDRVHHLPRIYQLATLLAHLDITEPIHLVGTSFGGSVALRASATNLLRLRSVISIGGPGPILKTPVMNTELGHWDGTKSDLARIVELLMDRNDYFEEQVAQRFAMANTAAHFRSLVAPGVEVPPTLTGAPRDAWPDLLEASSTRTLLVAGTRDELFEHVWPDVLAERIDNCRIARVDARHSPNLDRPQQVADLIGDFCEDG